MTRPPGRPALHTLPEALALLRAFIAAHGYAPSVKEFQRVLGARSKSTAWTYLLRLEQAGWVTRLPGHARIKVLG